MSLIQPFRGLRPQTAYAAEVAAPPYDVLSSAEARGLAQGKRWSFLHISKAEIDLPEATKSDDPRVYAQAAHNLAVMRDQHILLRDPTPCYYHYRMRSGTHQQDGLVAIASVAAYNSQRIRKHELTRPEKEDDRVRQITALNAQTGPVLLAYADAPEIDALLAEAAHMPLLYDVGMGAGARVVQHSLRRIDAPDLIARLSESFSALPALYIADGHHRSAAAARVAAAQPDNPAAQAFLAVIFPQSQMRIMDYNRLVRDLNHLSPDDFIARINHAYTVDDAWNVHAPFQPRTHGEMGLYLAGRWFALRVRPELVPQDPVARLDVSLLSDLVLGPMLNITDLRRDARIDFVGGIRGLAALQERVDSGEMAAAFALPATRMHELMAVADTGTIMPPKSTWFEPKLADGLVSHVLD